MGLATAEREDVISVFHTLRGALKSWLLFIWFLGFGYMLFSQLKEEIHFLLRKFKIKEHSR